MEQKNQNRIQLGVDFTKTPVLYADSVNITINEFGIVLDVIQGIAGSNRAFVVARVGMSKEHAKKLIAIIAEKLASSFRQCAGDISGRDYSNNRIIRLNLAFRKLLT